MKEQKGFIYGALAAVTFSIYILVNRHVYLTYGVNVFDYTATFLIAGGLFALIGRLTKGIGEKDKLNKSSWQVAANGVIAGVGLGIFVFGQGYTTVTNASILATSTAITTAIFSVYLLKDKLTSRELKWFCVMLAGFYIAIVGLHGLHLNKGDLLVLASSLILGFTNTFSKVLMKHHTSQFIADGRLICGGVFFALLATVIHGPDFLVMNAGLWPLLAGFFFWLTIRCFYGAISYINPNKAIILANSHPIFTPVVGAILFSEAYTLNKFVGAVLLVASIYSINMGKIKIPHTLKRGQE